MFYSHEILSERKYGIATVWLVATLGLSRTALRKVGRKEILSVNLPKACNTVTDSAVPLALRLQSGLLIGITRVYSQQFDYLYHDVSQAHITIKNLDSVKKTHLDLARGGEGRPDQLVLPNDPDLAPDLLPLLDLEVLGDLDPMNLNIDNFLAQHLQELGADSQEVRSFTPSQGRLSGFMTPAGVNSSPGTIGRMSTPGFPGSGFGAPTSPVALDEDLRMDENPLFEFDENGMIREISPQLPVSPSAALGLRARRGREGGNLNSDDIEEQVRREHEAGQVDQQVNQGEELGGGYVPPTADHMNIDENAQPFADREELPDAPVQQEEEAEVAVPAARKPRAPKASHITIDDLTELNGRVLKEWDANYLENMDVAKQVLDDRRAKRDAKNTATILVLEYGIGGELVNPTLRAMFSGRALLDIFMGEDSDAKNKRKSPSHENGEIAEKEEEGRRVRLRTEDEGDMGRGFEPNMQDIDMEVGRDAPASIAEDDVQSLHSDMPWVPLSVDGIGSSSAPGSVADFSPLQARNIWGVSRMSAVGSVGSRLDVVEEVNENTMGVSREPSVDAFEFFGAAAEFSTQDMDTQWLAATFQRESFGFLEFVKKKHSEENAVREENLEEEVDFITFHSLIKVGQNRRIVAAQAFHHTLLLATKGLITVSQESPFGTIQMSVNNP